MVEASGFGTASAPMLPLGITWRHLSLCAPDKATVRRILFLPCAFPGTFRITRFGSPDLSEVVRKAELRKVV